MCAPPETSWTARAWGGSEWMRPPRAGARTTSASLPTLMPAGCFSLPRDAETVARFAADLAERGGDPEKITDTSSDMSTAFISGISQYLPNARMTFDRYHLAAKLSEAIDAVRREELATRPELTHTRWGVAQELGESLGDATPRATPPDASLSPTGHRPGAALAGGLPGLLRPAPSYAPEYLRRWCYGAKRSRLQPIKEFVTLVEKHWNGIITWHKNHTLGFKGFTQHRWLVSSGPGLPQQDQDNHHRLPHRSQTPLPRLTNPTPAYMPSR
jgi:Transposase